MPKVALLNVEGAQVGEIELNDEVFGIEPNESVVHEAVVMQMASWRQGTHCTKSRGEVRARRPQTMETERNWSCQSWHYSFPTVAWRCYYLRAKTKKL